MCLKHRTNVACEGTDIASIRRRGRSGSRVLPTRSLNGELDTPAWRTTHKTVLTSSCAHHLHIMNSGHEIEHVRIEDRK